MSNHSDKKISSVLRWFHLIATLWWATGGVILALIFPKSVLYVSLMSAWANTISHFAAYMAGRTEKREIEQDEAS